MDLYLIAHISLTIVLLAGLAAAFLLWVDEVLDQRTKERSAREALATAEKEVSLRPRVAATTRPLPTINLKGTSTS